MMGLRPIGGTLALLLHAAAAQAAVPDPPALLGAGSPGIDTRLEVALSLEYSTFLDLHRLSSEHLADRAGVPLSPFGARLEGAWSEGPLRFGVALTLFPERSLAGSFEGSVAYTRRWRSLGLVVGGGLGALLTQRGTLVPTWTDVVVGPAIHAGGELRWHFGGRLFVGGRLALYLYPLQPLMIVPVGLDPRWSIGLGTSL